MNGLYIACGCGTVAVAMAANAVLNKRINVLSDDLYKRLDVSIKLLEKRVDVAVRNFNDSKHTRENENLMEQCKHTEKMINEIKDDKNLKFLLEQKEIYIDKKISKITDDRLEGMRQKLEELNGLVEKHYPITRASA